MPPAENLESVNVFFDKVLNSGDLASLEGFAHTDVVLPQSSPGIESFRRLLSEMRSTFSDPEYRILDAVADGDKVAVRFAGKATHSGRYMGLPSSGRPLKLWGVMMFRFESGAIAEFWSLVDAQGILGQLRGP